MTCEPWAASRCIERVVSTFSVPDTSAEALRDLARHVDVDADVLESLVNSLGVYYSKLLTGPEVEALLGVSRQTLYRLVTAGELTRINLGSAARYPLRSVVAYVDRKIADGHSGHD